MAEITFPPCTHIGHGVRVVLDWDYHRLAHAADAAIRELTAPYPSAATLYARLLEDQQVMALWDLTGWMAIEKLGYNDHGQMHAQVVTASALRLLNFLIAAEVMPDVVTSGAGTLEEAFVVVLVAALLHDIGNQVSREGHEAYSAMLAQPVLGRLLPEVCPDPTQVQVLMGFILSAIASHDCSPPPVTLEGGIVAVADGADMTQGRGQVAFDRGKADIHALSAMAIREVDIRASGESPVHIEVTMDNPAGLFQVEKLLARKILLSRLDRFISLRVSLAPEEDQALRDLRLVLRQGRFQAEGMPQKANEPWPVDPVCGMPVAPQEEAGTVIYGGIRYRFCSEACLTSFRDNPSHYI